MSKKIFKDSVVYITGEILSKLMPFLLIPYLSRKLGTEGYGQLSYYQTYLMLFIVVIGLTQEGAVARYFYVYGKRGIDLILRTGYVYAIILGLVIFSVCWLLDSSILMYISIASVLRVFVNVQLSIWQCKKRPLTYTFIQFLLTLTSVVFTIAFFELSNNLLVEKYFIALLLGNLIVFFIAYFLYRRDIKKMRNFSLSNYKTALLYLFSFGVPLLLHNVSGLIKGQADRFLIYHKYSESELGIYAMGANLALMLTTLILAINKATMPYYYEALRKQKITLKNIHLWALYSLLFVPVAILVVSLIPESLFLWILGDEFVGVKNYFRLFVISSVLIVPYLLWVNYLFYSGKTKEIGLISIASTGIYMLFLFLLLDNLPYLPLASVAGAIGILPLLYVATQRVKK